MYKKNDIVYLFHILYDPDHEGIPISPVNSFMVENVKNLLPLKMRVDEIGVESDYYNGWYNTIRLECIDEKISRSEKEKISYYWWPTILLKKEEEIFSDDLFTV